MYCLRIVTVLDSIEHVAETTKTSVPVHDTEWVESQAEVAI